MRNSTVDIIIPTWNNGQQLAECVSSIVGSKISEGLYHIIVVNNGHKDSCNFLKDLKEVTVIDAEDNLGWEGGLKLGLSHSNSPYVMFLNDDTFIPTSSGTWLNDMLQVFSDKYVAAVGPSTNVAMGWQNIWSKTPISLFETKFLIFFCVLLKREYVDKVGGIDSTLPGGDDFDLCIRLRNDGYKVVCNKNVFVYHHGFQTGTRVYGDHTKTGGWNSYEFKEATDHALIKKHGFAKWWEVISSAYFFPHLNYAYKEEDVEGNCVRAEIKGDKILDLGCGGNKTVPHAIGVDKVSKDETITTLRNSKSQSDVVADVSKPLPFDFESVDTIVARHILEHMIDPVDTLINWRSVLKVGGRLIIAVPNQYLLDSIPLNSEHVHAFTPDSLRNLLTVTGYKVLKDVDPDNGISFVMVAEKVTQNV